MTGVPFGPGCQPSASAAEEASSQSGIPNADHVAALIAVLRDVSTDAMYRKDKSFGAPYSVAKALSFVEEHEVTKPCRSCGRPQTDYTYSKLTLAGQAYLGLAIVGLAAFVVVGISVVWIATRPPKRRP